MGEIAAGLVAPWRLADGLVTNACGVAEGLMAATARHPADAVEQQRSADHAGCCRGRGSEKRAATAAERALEPAGLLTVGRLTVGRLTIGCLSVLSGRLRLLHHLAAVPNRAAGGLRWWNIRHPAAGRILPENRLPHRIEEPAGLMRFGRAVRLQRLNPGVGALERFILQQHGLHQRVNRVGRLTQAFRDRRDGVRIARRALHLGEAVEKVVNQLAFLRYHGFSPSLASKRGGDVGGLYVASSGGAGLNLGMLQPARPVS